MSCDRLIVGAENSDDAAVYKLTDDIAIIETIDFFPPMADSPYVFGQIAAANALSDVYAMGGEPLLALNLLCFPSNKLSAEHVSQILKGGQDKVHEAGALLVGGHTIEDEQPIYGLSVTGTVHPKKVLTNAGAKCGDALLLTKPLGTGVLTSAARFDMLSPSQYESLTYYMARLNKYAKEAMDNFRVNSCTDITGFGFAGHAYEMAQASNCTLRLYSDSVPLMDGAYENADMGFVPAGTIRNRKHLEGDIYIEKNVSVPHINLLFDPQTSGGLLISIDKSNTEKLLYEIKRFEPSAAIVGEVLPKGEYSIEII